MNKYYAIFFFIKGEKYCEVGTYHTDEFTEMIKKYHPNKLIRNDDVLMIYGIDLI